MKWKGIFLKHYLDILLVGFLIYKVNICMSEGWTG